MTALTIELPLCIRNQMRESLLTPHPIPTFLYLYHIIYYMHMMHIHTHIYKIVGFQLIIFVQLFCDPMNHILPSSYVLGILQATILAFPSLGDLPDPRIKSTSPALTGKFSTTKPPGKPHICALVIKQKSWTQLLCIYIIYVYVCGDMGRYVCVGKERKMPHNRFHIEI